MKVTLVEVGPVAADSSPRRQTLAPSARTMRMLDAPILHTLVRMAVPNIVLVVVQALSSAVDAFYLGRLGPAVLAGIALVSPVRMLMVTTSAGALGGGISSAVARALGAGRRDEANALVSHNVMVITSLLAPSGVLALAGYGLAARLEYLLIPLVFGFGTALVTLVGTNVGAGQVRRARPAAWTGAGVAAAATGSVGLLVARAPDAWVGLFTADPAVLAIGESYLRIVGPTYALFGLGLALYFAAQGAGRLGPALLAGVGRTLVAGGGGWGVCKKTPPH